MLVRRYHTDSLELVRWAIVVALAMALTLTWAATVVGQTDAPKVLPKEATQHAQTITARVDSPEALDDYQTTLKLWNVIGELEEKNFVAAYGMLAEVKMPVETEVWQYVGMATCQLHMENYEGAVRTLQTAMEMDPQNPIPHYVLGKVRLIQARKALLWFEPPQPGTYYVSVPPVHVVPNTHGMYRMAAGEAFRQAVALADNLDPEARLLGVDWVLPPDGSGAMPVETPTVREFLIAVDATRYLGKSHLALASLDLERGRLGMAFNHLKEATQDRVRTGAVYRELGKAYQAAGEYRKATRAYLESMAHGGGTVTPLRNVLSNLGEALFRR